MSKNTTTPTFVWHELNTQKVDGARAFYGELFGWTFKNIDLGEMGPYSMFSSAGETLGGFATLDPRAKDAPHWLSYVGVASVDASAKRVPLLGGTVLVPPTDIPDMGRFAVIQDPSGARLAIYQR